MDGRIVEGRREEAELRVEEVKAGSSWCLGDGEGKVAPAHAASASRSQERGLPLVSAHHHRHSWLARVDGS